MAQPLQNTSLSLSARLLTYLGPPSLILLTGLASPKTALFSPLAFAPTAYAYNKWSQSNKRNHSRRGELEPMLWTYVSAGTLGLLGVGLIQMAVCKAVSFLLFGVDTTASKDFWTEFARGSIEGLTSDELAKRAAIAWSWKNWVFNGTLTFIAAGLGEEILKYLPIAYARRRGTAEERQKRNRAYLDYALAGALAFSLVENIGFLYASVEKGNETWSRLCLSVFERVIIGGTGHITMAVLTALRAIRRDYYGERLTLWEVLGPAALYHGAFDFVCFGASSWEGSVGWTHPTGAGVTSVMFGGCLGLVGAAMWQTRREWRGLEERDRVIEASKDEGEKK
jgi:RsiW-degrading membrane proteinase PrsW (M82 family)